MAGYELDFRTLALKINIAAPISGKGTYRGHIKTIAVRADDIAN